jgi:hypothetical protein
MQVESKYSGKLQDALNAGVLKRIPLTFLPFVNQQLNQWNYLFPNERQSVESLLIFVESLSPDQSSALFHDVVELEEKMGVRHWRFSTTEQTIQNSSQLAASPYFQEWRQAVQAVFDAADSHAAQADAASHKQGNRLVLLDIPDPLPLDSAKIWNRWQGIGKPVRLDLKSSDTAQRPLEFLLAGKGGSTLADAGLLAAARTRANHAAADVWVIDAGSKLTESILKQQPSETSAARPVLLSYERLNPYRENFSHEMNSMHKDLADADAVFDRLRHVDVSRWCPAEVAVEPAIREFIRSLYLAGNGAVIFGNSFVQWGAAEAFRRARPTVLAAQFGTRKMPKPFTGVAVFDNPDQVNPLPAADDLPGSAIDAQMLALYVWLAAWRFEEYQHSTACVCVAESVSQAYVVAPPEFALSDASGPVTLDRLGAALRAWIA